MSNRDKKGAACTKENTEQHLHCDHGRLGGSCAASQHLLRGRKIKGGLMMARSRHSFNLGAQPTQAQIDPSWSEGMGRQRRERRGEERSCSCVCTAFKWPLFTLQRLIHCNAAFTPGPTSLLECSLSNLVFKRTPDGTVKSLTSWFLHSL